MVVCMLALAVAASAKMQMKPTGFGPSPIGFPVLFAKDFTEANFNDTVRAFPGTHLFIECYAEWCPKCKQLIPEWERVAEQYNTDENPTVLFGKIECEKDDWKICTRLGVDGYPRMYWGTKEQFLFLEGQAKPERIFLYPWRSEEIQKVVNQKMGTNRAVQDKTTFAAKMAKHVAVAEKIDEAMKHQTKVDVWDIDTANALAFNIMFSGQPRYGKPLTPEKREFYVSWIKLLSHYYPSSKGRKSFRGLMKKTNTFWPPYEGTTNVTYVDPEQHRTYWTLSGYKWEDFSKGWHGCKGSYPYSRGYSCGLWWMFHAMSTRVQDVDATHLLRLIRDFIDLHFPCDECRDHFLKISEGEAAKMTNRRDVVMWLWKTHNTVNDRLSREDEAGSFSFDPAFPKVIFPTPTLCPQCRNADGSFNEDEVYKFLLEFYGTEEELGPFAGHDETDL